MSFKTSLYKLLDVAEIIIVEGYEIESSNDINAKQERRLECDEDNAWITWDQEVEVVDGETWVQGRGEYDDEDTVETLAIECKMIRHITQEDLT